MPVKRGKVGRQKNRSVAKKRIRITGSGKFAVEKAAHNHLLLQKNKAKKDEASRVIVLSKGDAAQAKKMLPSL